MLSRRTLIVLVAGLLLVVVAVMIRIGTESHMGPLYEGDRALGINGGSPLTVLAQTLEQPGEVSQGGPTYCHPHGASAIFARGIAGEDAGWTAFWLHDPARPVCMTVTPPPRRIPGVAVVVCPDGSA